MHRAGPDFGAALELVNAHEFGNGTAIYTRGGGTAREFSHHVQVGMVGVNVPIPVPMAFHSFGVWRRRLDADHEVTPPGKLLIQTFAILLLL